MWASICTLPLAPRVGLSQIYVQQRGSGGRERGIKTFIFKGG